MKGIWIPVEILHDDNLTMQEKLIICEISQLEMLDKGCIASNKHLGEKLKISPKSVSNTISSLASKGYIKTHIIEGSRNMQREIFTIHNHGNYYPQKMERVSTKDGETKERNTINNTESKAQNKFAPPTPEEIASFIKDRNLDVSVESFYLHYESNGWMVGKVKMKSWKHTVLKWHNTNQNRRIK